MNIAVIGINFRSASLEVRERFSFNLEEQQYFLEYFKQRHPAGEWALLSTCNRTELYHHGAEQQFNGTEFENELCHYKKLDSNEFRKYFYVYQGKAAVRHLFRVACGLDSLVLGEDQILGQVKKAHQTALAAGTSKAVLNTLFRKAVTGVKLIKSQTKLAKGPVSAAKVAVEKALATYGSTCCRTALVIGSGAMGVLTVDSLLKQGVAQIYIAARHLSKVRPIFSNRPQVTPVAYDCRYQYMDGADLVFSMTASPHYAISCSELAPALITSKKRVFMDLAVPRDIDREIATLPGIGLLNIDSLGEACREELQHHALDIAKAETIIDEQLAGFEKWYQSRQVFPLIQQIEATVWEEVSVKIKQTLLKLNISDPKEQAKIARGMRSIAGLLMNRCVYRIKDSASGAEAGIYYRCLDRAMRLEEINEDLRGRNRTWRQRRYDAASGQGITKQ